MTVKVGLLGLGFMGKCHFDAYSGIRGAKITAICDVDRKKLLGDWSSIAGNIGGAGGRVSLKGIGLYADPKNLFADANVDVVDITLPTYMHAANAIAALKAGKHVISEKPMAINSKDASKMIGAAKAAKKQLFVSHCIRFWPQYAKAREIIKSGKYGKVLSANFTRVSPTPTWSWKNWLMDSPKSGDAALDLHIHDADFILYTFGKPKSVTAYASGFKKGRNDHILASYNYPGNLLVTAEGAWDYAPGFPFGMSFRVVMEKASLDCPSNLELTLYPSKGKAVKVKCAKGDGYGAELKHFVECIATKKKSTVVSPESALHSVKLIEAEMKSAQSGKTVPVRI